MSNRLKPVPPSEKAVTGSRERIKIQHRQECLCHNCGTGILACVVLKPMFSGSGFGLCNLTR